MFGAAAAAADVIMRSSGATKLAVICIFREILLCTTNSCKKCENCCPREKQQTAAAAAAAAAHIRTEETSLSVLRSSQTGFVIVVQTEKKIELFELRDMSPSSSHLLFFRRIRCPPWAIFVTARVKVHYYPHPHHGFFTEENDQEAAATTNLPDDVSVY